MNAIALDPGITTGYAIGRIENRQMLVVSGEEKFDHKDLWEFLLSCNVQYIISERFEFRHGYNKVEGLEMYSRELIGVAKLFCQVNGCEMKLQNAMKDSPTTYFNDLRLKKLGMYKTARGHANDAVRHLLYWAHFKSGYQFVDRDNYKSGVLA